MRGLRGIPTERVQFLTVPRESFTGDPNRDQLVQPDAEKLFTRLRTDEPVTIAAPSRNSGADSGNSGRQGDPGGAESPAPTFSGNTADEDVCE